MTGITSLIDRERFDAIAAQVCHTPRGIDRCLLSLRAENSDFVRFNRSLIRQATGVLQQQASVSVVRGRRRSTLTTTISGDPSIDAPLLAEIRDRLIDELEDVPEDPLLLLPEAVQNTVRDPAGLIAPHSDAIVESIVESIVEAARGLDLVGFLMNGPVVAAFADSRGQRNWHHAGGFHFDWCLYQQGMPELRDRAVKSSFAGTNWSSNALQTRMQHARTRLELLERPAARVEPGRYRVLLEPAAMNEILSGLGWTGFSEKSRRTQTSALQPLAQGLESMSPMVRITEAAGDGLAPLFTADGFVRPASVTLVDAGRTRDALVSPRSAVEFGLVANSGVHEAPDSLALAPGAMPRSEALQQLDDGLLIGNLWYLNYSDRVRCRMTGMTRFACFQVQGGRIVAPITPMRFDDSAIRMLGDGLEALGDEAEWMPSNDTWGERQLASVSSPCALVRELHFTL